MITRKGFAIYKDFNSPNQISNIIEYQGEADDNAGQELENLLSAALKTRAPEGYFIYGIKLTEIEPTVK